MVTRCSLTARFWLAAAAGSVPYLPPANLDLGSAFASGPANNQFFADVVIRDFRGRFEKNGHPDFDQPSAASAGLAGSYTAGLVTPFPSANGKLGKGIFEYDPKLDWLDVSAPTAADVNGLSFVDASIGFAACGTTGSSTGAIIKTTSADAYPWKTVHTATSVLTDIDMVDASTGWAVGLGGYLVKTSDGGASWDPQNTGPAANHFAVSAVDASTAFIAGNSGTVYHTVDGGSNWTRIPDTRTGTDKNLLGIRFVNALTGWAVGANGTIIKTIDGGATWSSQAPPGQTLRGIWARDPRNVWVAGNAGMILHTSNGGATWTPQVSATTEQLNGVSFSDDGAFGVVAGNGGVILTTSNGGTTWSAVTRISGTANLNDVVYVIDPPRPGVGCSGNVTGYAAVAGGRIKRHTRAGVQITAEWMHTIGNSEARQMYADTAGDTAGAHNAPHNGFITAPETLCEWYVDVPGKNLSKLDSFEFVRNGIGPGSYFVYDAPSFFPIDDQLFGNPPGAHNYLFTVESDWLFEYDSSDGQWLTVRTNGDAWLYINDQLVIDMGGTHGVTKQYVDITRLGLTNGRKYHVKFFMAERQVNVPYSLMIATNVYLETPGKLAINDVTD